MIRSRAAQKILRTYIEEFLGRSAHREYFDQNPEELFSCLLDAGRISIPLMPVDKQVSSSGDYEAINAWYFKYVQPYTRYHKQFINELPPAVRRQLYGAKLLAHPREKNLRHFLARLAKCPGAASSEQSPFFDGLDLDRNLVDQGVEVLDCEDYSSGRGYDEGAVVNRVTLKRNGGKLALFLKGTGKVRKQKLEKRGINGFETFEVTMFEAARIVGMNSIECEFYPDDDDPMMTGYTLLEEIKGINSNALFQLLPGRRFIIHPDFARHRDQLIREFARVAALGDLLRKDDRIIVQALHTEYDANYMVNLERLGKPGRDAVYTIDHNHLFARSNYSLLQDIKYARCTEIGIVSAFEPFYTNPTGREDMLARYEKTYLEQWEKIVSRRVPLSGLIAHNYGPDSKEYKVFQQSLRSDPRKEFADQKAELLGTLSET